MEYSFEIENYAFIVKRLSNSDGSTVLDYFSIITQATQLNVYFPFNSPDVIKIDYWFSSTWGDYKIERNVGFIYIEETTDRIFGPKYVKYSLVEFSVD